MNDIALQFILICLVQLVLIILYRQSKNLLHRKIFTKSTLSISKTILFICMAILYIVFFIHVNEYHQPQPLESQTYIKNEALPSVSSEIVREIGGRKTSKIVNLYFLYLGADKSEKTVADVAMRLRQQYCTQLCIINIYDEKPAFDKDIQRVSITSNDVMKAWNKANYVFVADHYLGYLDAVPEASFNYYPFHDSYYKHAVDGTLSSY